MSRLDYHVNKVQSKMLLTGMLQALAWSLLVYGGGRLGRHPCRQAFQLYLPRQFVWLYAGLGVAVVAAVVRTRDEPADAASTPPSRSTSGWD